MKKIPSMLPCSQSTQIQSAPVLASIRDTLAPGIICHKPKVCRPALKAALILLADSIAMRLLKVSVPVWVVVVVAFSLAAAAAAAPTGIKDTRGRAELIRQGRGLIAISS